MEMCTRSSDLEPSRNVVYHCKTNIPENQPHKFFSDRMEIDVRHEKHEPPQRDQWNDNGVGILCEKAEEQFWFADSSQTPTFSKLAQMVLHRSPRDPEW